MRGGVWIDFPFSSPLPLLFCFYAMHSTLVTNHGCTSRPTDPLLTTYEQYDAAYIEKTVYNLAMMDDPLGVRVKEALDIIEEAYRLYG
jgi:hypothetical protein